MDVSITAYGAKKGCDIAGPLQKAVAVVGKSGGGRVKVPTGLWKLDNAKTIIIDQDDVTIEGESARAVVEVVNWQPFLPKPPRPDGHADATNHAGIIVGSPTGGVAGFTLRRLKFVSKWAEGAHPPFGPQGDSKGLIMLGWPDQQTYVRRTFIQDVQSDRCGSYLLSVTGRHAGLEIQGCSVQNQYASAFACVGAHFDDVPKINACSAKAVTGFGIQWTGPATVDRFVSDACRGGGIMLINNEDAPGAFGSLLHDCTIRRAGGMDSDLFAGSGIYVGGEYYGGRRVRVTDCRIQDSFGSGIAWGGGVLKDITIEGCRIENFGLGCGTDNPDRPWGKQSGIQPTAGISLAGYKIKLEQNTITGWHQGYHAGQRCCRYGIWLGATEADGNIFRASMLGVKDCASKDRVTGTFAEGRLYLPSNASDT